MDQKSQRLAVTAVALGLAITLLLPKTDGAMTVVVAVVAVIAMSVLAWQLSMITRENRKNKK